MNLPLWSTELEHDLDKTFLMNGLTNGFELVSSDVELKPAEMHNYFSVTNPSSRAKVEATLKEELAAGNYQCVSCKPTIVSALGAVPKPDSTDIRLIHDCSMPPCRGVNSYIEVERQHFQTLDDAVNQIKKGYFIAKVDLRHAYRSVPVHPSNYMALGLKWKFTGSSTFTYMVDTRLPFGSSSSPGIFHRLTQSIRRMMARRGYVVVVYLDDFLVIGKTQAECQQAYDILCSLLLDLGFELSSKKLVPPCQELVFLGILINCKDLTLKLPEEKLSQLRSELSLYLTRTRATKRQLQQLAGRLNWACKVVFGGRTFLRRVLDMMNTMSSSASQCRLTPDFHRDIEWWAEFLDTFNGMCDFTTDRPITDLSTDASSTGLGAFFRGDWLYINLFADYPKLSHLHINFKEALCIVFAAFRWGHTWQNHTVKVFCDNMAAVAIINKGTTKSPIMMFYLRQLFWLSARYNFRLQVVHLPGKLNTTADHISRLDQRNHFLEFLTFLHGGFLPVHSPIPALEHMPYKSYAFLLGKFFLE